MTIDLINYEIRNKANTLIFDLETSVKNKEPNNPVGNMEASPFHPMNEIVMVGWTMCHWGRSASITLMRDFLDVLSVSDILVGHNIKFDLLYLLMHHKEDIMSFFKRGGVIWDTMQAEYLFSAQQEKFSSLGNKYKDTTEEGDLIKTKKLIKQGLAEKYGGTDKDDRIKEFWDKGIDTEDIPRELLAEYCKNDVQNTALIYKGQLQRCMPGSALRNLVQTQMQAIVATTIMEYNGMKFDIDVAAKGAKELEKDLLVLEEWLHMKMWSEFDLWNSSGYPIPFENINAGSVKQLNLFLFGGEYKWAAPVRQIKPDGSPDIIKSGPNKGKQRTKLESVSCEIIPSGGTTLVASITSQLEKTIHGFKLDDDAITRVVIPEYARALAATGNRLFLEKLLSYRGLKKDLNTYYISLIELMWGTDGCIHGSLNHCSTHTGRLSSSAPNMQNIAG